MGVKAKVINMVATMLRNRAARLEAELERDQHKQSDAVNAADRAAILEITHCAQLVECLALGAVKGDPYVEARARLGRHHQYKAPE